MIEVPEKLFPLKTRVTPLLPATALAGEMLTKTGTGFVGDRRVPPGLLPGGLPAGGMPPGGAPGEILKVGGDEGCAPAGTDATKVPSKASAMAHLRLRISSLVSAGTN